MGNIFLPPLHSCQIPRILLIGSLAVSYTHLDVYKRQILATEILALQNSQLKDRIKAYREEMKEAVIQANRELNL